MADSAPEKCPESGNETENVRIEHVSIPKKDWEEMKAQNLRILQALGQNEKPGKVKNAEARGRKRARKISDSDDSSVCRPMSEGEIRDDSPQKKKLKSHQNLGENDCVIDLDDQIDDHFAGNDVKQEEEEEDTGLQEIMKEFEAEEETGLPISEKLACIVDNMAKAKIPEEKLVEKMERHKRPENCPVTVPKVNQELWGLMDRQAKARNLKSQRDQKRLVKATYALARVCDGLTKPSQDKKAMLKDVTDAMALVLKTSHEMSVDRRLKIVNCRQLNKKYKALASSDVPITERLFGDDLKGSLTAIDSASKLGQTMSVAQRTPKKFVGRMFQSKKLEGPQPERQRPRLEQGQDARSQRGTGQHQRSPTLAAKAPPQLETKDQTLQDKTRVVNTDKEFRVCMDVQHFTPEEISIKTKDNRVVISGKHEERPEEHGFIQRQFTRQCVLPKDVDPTTVTSSLSRGGVLTLKAPKVALEGPKETTIPITMEPSQEAPAEKK